MTTTRVYGNAGKVFSLTWIDGIDVPILEDVIIDEHDVSVSISHYVEHIGAWQNIPGIN